MTRDERLEAAGRKLAGWGAAVAWTMGNQGDLAKRCGSRWDESTPLGDPEFAAALFKGRGQTKNPAVVLRPSGLIGIETDSDDDLMAFQMLHLPETAAVRSSGPGRMHFYFRAPHHVSHYGFRFEQGRVFGDTGRYFVAPPAIHPTGVEYEFANDLAPTELNHDQYLQLLTQARQAVVEQARELQTDGGKVAPGNRRMTLFSLARKMAYGGMPEDSTLTAMLDWNATRCEPPLTREQVEEQVSGAYSQYPGQVSDVLGAPSPEDYRPEVLRLSEALELYRKNPPTEGIPFPSPDFVICRLNPGHVMFLGGYPGDGKSSAALQTCLTNEGLRVLYFSYEMNARDIIKRTSVIAGVDPMDLRADERFANVELYLSEDRETPHEIVERNGPYDLVVIDHLHELGYEDRRVLEQWAQYFKRWAMKLDIPFLVLGQLKKSDTFERPQQSAFRDTAMISAVADLEVYIWRERENGEPQEAAEILIRKDRHDGRTGTELVTWDKDRACLRPRFSQLHVQPEHPHVEPQERELQPFEDGGEWDTSQQGYFR